MLDLPDVVRILATSRPTGDTSAQFHALEVEDDDCDRAFEQVNAEVPVGSALLRIRIRIKR